MDKFNLNFDGGDNIIKSICWILSVLSWLLFLVTGWISFNWFEEKLGRFSCIWTIQKIHTPGYYAPFQMQISLIYILSSF